MKEPKNCYRGRELFDLYRFIVSECEEVNAYGVFLFLCDNDYEVVKFTCDELSPDAEMEDHLRNEYEPQGLSPDVLDEIERMEGQVREKQEDAGPARWDKGEVPIEPLVGET